MILARQLVRLSLCDLAFPDFLIDSSVLILQPVIDLLAAGVIARAGLS